MRSTMMMVAVATVAMGCAPEDLEGDGSWSSGLHTLRDADDMRAVLVDAPRDAFSERTRVRHAAHAYGTPGGAPLTGDTWWTDRSGGHVVVDIRDEQLGVLVEHRTTQLVVWLDRQDLELVPVVHTWMGGPKGADVGVRVPAGTPLEPVGVGQGETRVKVENDSVRVDTWVPDVELDHYWYSDAPMDDWEVLPLEGPSVRVLSEVELLDAPDGRVFATTHPDRSFHFAAVQERDQEWVRVAFRAGDWPVEAWVHELDTASTEGWGLGRSGGASFGCGGCSGMFRHNVAAGTWLHAGAEGPVIGRVKRDTWLTVEDDEGDWLHGSISTQFGDVPVSWPVSGRIPW